MPQPYLMIRSALVFIHTVYALCITLMQVMGSVNLHESAEPSGECSERQKQTFCECERCGWKTRKPTTCPTFLGHYFQTLKQSTSSENHCNASDLGYVGIQQFIFSPQPSPPKNTVIKTWWIAFTPTLVCNPSRQRPQASSYALSYVGINCEYL